MDIIEFASTLLFGMFTWWRTSIFNPIFNKKLQAAFQNMDLLDPQSGNRAYTKE